jgi:DNA-binding NarL/FixJ family response regulator
VKAPDALKRKSKESDRLLTICYTRLQIFTEIASRKAQTYRWTLRRRGFGLDARHALDAIDGALPDRATPDAAGFAEQNRRHLAIVDRSELRRDCFKLALGQQPRRWRVTEVEATTDLVRLLRQGAGFSVILLVASTSWQIELIDLALLTTAAGQIPVLVVADCDDAERARMILRSGAKGFLPMNQGLRVLVAALERIRTGGTFVPLALTASTGDGVTAAKDSPQRVLTRRQRDVLALIAEGKSNKLIADALGMSESTVKAHVKQIIRRLNVANRTQAALLATRGRRHPLEARAEVLEQVL